MDNRQLYGILELPNEVIFALDEYEKNRNINISPELVKKLLFRDTWDAGIGELKALVGDDENGFFILWELLDLVCDYSYGEYRKNGIPDEIFADTMRWCTRSLDEHRAAHGKYGFTLAWWFPRLLSLNEFRLGVLSYEFVDGKKKEISLHIPSDASLMRKDILDSLKKFNIFCERYYPEWKGAPIVCYTWMLAPALDELLDENSKILAFKDMFEIDKTEPDASWFMGYIFPGHKEIDRSLPEKTSLQRRLKKHLLEGKKLGAAKGHLKDEFRRIL